MLCYGWRHQAGQSMCTSNGSGRQSRPVLRSLKVWMGASDDHWGRSIPKPPNGTLGPLDSGS